MNRAALLPLATAVTYSVPAWVPDGPLAFYIGRGWLGCLFAWALYRGWQVGALTLAALVAWEASASLCGAFFAGIAPAATGALCDQGTGLPLTLPSLAITLAACVFDCRGKQDG